jgi:hypothetical protein
MANFCISNGHRLPRGRDAASLRCITGGGGEH